MASTVILQPAQPPHQRTAQTHSQLERPSGPFQSQHDRSPLTDSPMQLPRRCPGWSPHILVSLSPLRLRLHSVSTPSSTPIPVSLSERLSPHYSLRKLPRDPVSPGPRPRLTQAGLYKCTAALTQLICRPSGQHTAGRLSQPPQSPCPLNVLIHNLY
jgi:hypothetical protein